MTNMLFNKSIFALCGLALAAPVTAAEFEYGGILAIEYSDSQQRLAGVTDHQDAAYIATLELSGGVVFNEHWQLNATLLAEDIDNTNPDDYRPRLHQADDRPDILHLEELVLTYTQDQTEISAGRYTLPFGDFETTVITDPQTLEVGETRTSLGASLRHAWGDFSAKFSWFNGNLRSTVPDESGFSAGLDYALSDNLRLGAGYLSSQGAMADAPALWNLYAAAEQGDWRWHAEYVATDHEQNGERPRAWSLDVGYDINPQWAAGARYQQTDRAGVLDGGNGEYREWAVAGFYTPRPHLTFGLEYAAADEGPAEAQQWLLQAAFEF